jgi:ABC-type branched-subunit amino acid transport system substrate-binding protein
MDSAQSVAAVIQAEQAGIDSLVIVASEIEGHQLQLESAVAAAEELGVEVKGTMDIQAEMPTYADTIEEIQALNPGALVVLTTAGDGGTFVRNAAEAGLSTVIIGTTEWQGEEFLATATAEALEQHEAVWVVAFAHADSRAWSFYRDLWNDSDYSELASAGNSYNLQYYDLLNVTALAIEAAGTTDASVWVDYVRDVAEAPGQVVYTYAEGIEALRAGEDIDYSGVSGEMEYTSTGVVSGLFGIFEWTSEGELIQVNVVDDALVLNLDR